MHVPHRFSGIGTPAPLLSRPLATPAAGGYCPRLRSTGVTHDARSAANEDRATAGYVPTWRALHDPFGIIEIYSEIARLP